MSQQNSIRGMRNRANGEAWENKIDHACEYYRSEELAVIEKTPEPMKPLSKSDSKGRFLACFTKQAQPDYKGSLCDGTCIIFDAKHTDQDRIHQSAITDTQWEILDDYEKMNAKCYVMVSMGLVKFYRVPWKVWKDMKSLYNHKYMNEENLKKYQVPEQYCTVLILEGVELSDKRRWIEE